MNCHHLSTQKMPPRIAFEVFALMWQMWQKNIYMREIFRYMVDGGCGVWYAHALKDKKIATFAPWRQKRPPCNAIGVF